MTPVTAFTISALASAAVWLFVTRLAARRETLRQDHLLWATSWAAIHAINGTTPQDECVADELREMRFCAATHAAADHLYPGVDFDDLSVFEQCTARAHGRAALVAAGHMTVDYAVDAYAREVNDFGFGPQDRLVDEYRCEMYAAKFTPATVA